MTKQDMSSTYYHIYNYSHFIDLINGAFDTSYSSLRALIPKVLNISRIDATTSPFLDFDTVLNRVILYADNDSYSIVYTEAIPELQNNPLIEIYFNERLCNLFVGLPCKYMTKHGDLNYKLKVTTSLVGLFQKVCNGPGRS